MVASSFLRPLVIWPKGVSICPKRCTYDVLSPTFGDLSICLPISRSQCKPKPSKSWFCWWSMVSPGPEKTAATVRSQESGLTHPWSGLTQSFWWRSFATWRVALGLWFVHVHEWIACLKVTTFVAAQMWTYDFIFPVFQCFSLLTGTVISIRQFWLHYSQQNSDRLQLSPNERHVMLQCKTNLYLANLSDSKAVAPLLWPNFKWPSSFFKRILAYGPEKSTWWYPEQNTILTCNVQVLWWLAGITGSRSCYRSIGKSLRRPRLGPPYFVWPNQEEY